MHNRTLPIGDWRLDPHANRIFNDKQSCQLEHKQVQLLLFLIVNAGIPVSKHTLLSEIWAGRFVVEDVLAVAISRLRKGLQDHARAPQYIKTIPGVGYQFIYPMSPKCIAFAEQCYRGTVDISNDVINQPLSAKIEMHWHRIKCKKPAIYLLISMFFIVIAWAKHAQMTSPEGSIKLSDQSAELKSHVKAPEPLPTDIQQQYQQAWDLRHSFQQHNTHKAIELLQDIIRRAPNFADAYVLLAKTQRDVYFGKPLIEYHASDELKALVEKALIIDPHSSFAHETLGVILFFVDWNQPQAGYHLRKAVQLDPNNAEAHHSFGLYLLAHGEFDESYQEIEIARKLNPLNYSIATVAWIYAMQDRHEDAWKETEKLLTLQPNDLQYHRSALRLFENAGDEQKAYSHLRNILELAQYDNNLLIQLDAIFKNQKLKGVYHWLAYNHPEERDIGFYPPPLSYARFAISAGEYDDAFKWLKEAYQQHQGLLIWLAVDPKYKSLRADPRYGDLLQKLGLRELTI